MEAESLVDDDEYEDRQMDLSAKTCLQIPLQIGKMYRKWLKCFLFFKTSWSFVGQQGNFSYEL